MAESEKCVKALVHDMVILDSVELPKELQIAFDVFTLLSMPTERRLSN